MNQAILKANYEKNGSYSRSKSGCCSLSWSKNHDIDIILDGGWSLSGSKSGNWCVSWNYTNYGNCSKSISRCKSNS